MEDEKWAAIEAHFEALRELAPEQRTTGLRNIADEDVRREVASLLEHVGGGETVTGVVESMVARFDSSLPFERIGAYRLVRRLAAGGQGAVFEAVRDDASFEQRVAIKLVKWEIDSEPARRRFRDERQILASLAHPYIARLLDGGEARSGTPYLVMEFIDGLPIIQATEGWAKRRKLELFVKVAEAVAAAHRKLIVHRDLKPSNILVTKDGSPKLLDFGIAKLLDAGDGHTQTAFPMLTPDYASPEQVRGLPISTASDVYSLGVVLYQLLTGRKPYQLDTATPMEMDRVICEQPPAPPGLDSEFDAILAMALRKEPERRYQDVEAFAEDIRHYLDGRPVLARPDTISYRARKYVRRHWIGLLAAAIALGGVLGGAGVAVYQARIAQQRFQQLRRLAHSFVFDYQDDLAKVQGNTAVREKMVSTALVYLDSLAHSASTDPDLQKELAAAYQKVGDAQGFPTKPNLGHTQNAIASYRKAAQIHETIASHEPAYRADLGGFYREFSSLLRYTHDYPGAIRMTEAALHSEEQRARAQPDDEAAQIRLVRAWDERGDLDEDLGYYREALAHNRSGDAIAETILKRWRNGDALRAAASTAERVATDAQYAGHLSEALAGFEKEEKLLAELRNLGAVTPTDMRRYAVFQQYRGGLYCDDVSPNLEDAAKCLQYAKQYLELAQEMVKADPNDATAKFSEAAALSRLSFALKSLDPAGAIEAAQDSVRLYEQQAASGGRSYLIQSRHARSMRRLAYALLSGGRVREARAAAEAALSEQRNVAALDPEDRGETELVVAALLTAAETAEAGEERASALRYLTEARAVSAELYSKMAGEMFFAFMLGRAQEALATYWKIAGEAAQARYWIAATQSLWRDFPDPNEYVRRKSAHLVEADR